MKDIKTIADYTVFKKLASALWQKEYFYHGAAIMIGAGLVDVQHNQVNNI